MYLRIGVAIALMLPGLAWADLPQATNWSGCYGGLSAGYVVDGKSSKVNAVYAFGSLHTAEPNNTFLSGPLGGVTIGCNDQFFADSEFSHIVFGAELDGWGQDVGGTSYLPNTLSPGETIRSSVESTFTGSAALRLGYAFQNWLIYGKGGVALTTFKHNGNIFNDASGATADVTSNSKKTSVGYLLGAGTGFALSSHWSAQLEYNYIRFGSVNTNYQINLDPGTPIALTLRGPSKSHEDEQILKASIIYRF